MGALLIDECWGRVGEDRPAWSERRGARCGNKASYDHNVDLGGENVVIGLCRLHKRVLDESSDPLGLAQAWALDVPITDIRGAAYYSR